MYYYSPLTIHHMAPSGSLVMTPQRLFCFLLVVGLIGGCSSPAAPAKPRRQGPKINIPHFIKHTATYKGKTLTLGLKLDEAEKGQSLRDFVGRDVKFTTTAPSGENLNLVITIPKDLSVPEANASDDLVVTFICQRGELRQGNIAKMIQRSDSPWEDLD
jgi:hypothetical protein